MFIENTHVRRARALEDDEVEMISYELLVCPSPRAIPPAQTNTQSQDIVEKAHQGQVNIGNWAEGGQWTFQQYPLFASRVEALLHSLKVRCHITHVTPHDEQAANGSGHTIRSTRSYLSALLTQTI